MKHKLLFKNYLKTFFLFAFFAVGNFGFGQNTYNLVTSTAELVAGSKYIIASSQTNGTGAALGYQNTNNRPQASITINSGVISSSPAMLNSETTKVFEITLGGSPGAYTLYDPVNSGFLKASSSSSNYLVSTAPSADWSISFTSNAAVMTCLTGNFTRNILRYNATSTLFACYSSGQASVYLYKLVPKTWNGSNGSWSTSSNWTPSGIPTSSDDVSIPSGTPILDVNFTFGIGRTLTISGSGRLTINPVNTLTVAGTADFGGKNVTLKSDATGTASIGQVTGTLTGATNVTVERYIAGRRAFRFLTPGVTTSTTIRANWQDGGGSTAGVGTHITGSTTGANGFDLTTTGNPSLATYNAQIASGTGFVNAIDTDMATLKAGVGYRLLVRGDRGVNLSAATPDDNNFPTTLSATGTLKTGTVTFNATDAINSPVLINNQAGNTQTNGYTLIGNPYASPVDWNAVTKTGVSNNAYYTWDPTLGTAAQRGRYVVYTYTDVNTDGVSNVYDPSTGTLNSTNRRYLQTGQAVFIKNADLTVPAILTFNEANKASTNAYVFKNNQQAATVTGNASLYLTVYDSNELAIGAAPIDGSVALFGTAYNNALDANDVDKLTTSGENLAFARENKNLAIETLAPVVANDELFVKTVQFQAGKNYTFKVNTANFDTAVTAKMIDLYLNTETAIDLTQPSFVTFATTADANSYGSDRFKIVFNNAALGNGSFNASAVAIYPNPIANNEFTIALPNSVSGNVTVKMSNMLGQEVYSRTAEATTTMQIQPKQQLEEGMYVVSISNNGQVIQAKVIVKN